MEKPADTTVPLLDVIRRRWSPRAFSDRAVEPAKLRQVFEAARWASSSFNEQPWRYVVATKDRPEAFATALSCLVEKNQEWAKAAPVLVLTLTRRTFSQNGRPNRVALHDLGQATAQLVLQALALDLFAHQMGGILPDRVREAYEVPDDYEPQTAFALGYAGDPASLPEDLRNIETGSRRRRTVDEFVFAGRFGAAAQI